MARIGICVLGNTNAGSIRVVTIGTDYPSQDKGMVEVIKEIEPDCNKILRFPYDNYSPDPGNGYHPMLDKLERLHELGLSSAFIECMQKPGFEGLKQLFLDCGRNLSGLCPGAEKPIIIQEPALREGKPEKWSAGKIIIKLGFIEFDKDKEGICFSCSDDYDQLKNNILEVFGWGRDVGFLTCAISDFGDEKFKEEIFQKTGKNKSNLSHY